MDNFKVYNPTCLIFGRDVAQNIGKKASEFGNRVLLVYGKGSVMKNGAYRTVVESLQKEGVEIIEYNGIKSNPVFEDVDAAAALAKKHQADAVIAVGGGSVIDSAKIIAITAKANHSSWDFLADDKKPTTALPVISVLTMAATGSEMNPYAVIQNNLTRQKIGYGHPLLYPKYSFLDPAYTLSVPYNYTSYGITDIIVHCLEAYFGKGNCDLSDHIAIAIINEVMHKGKNLLSDLNNYDLRADIMLASTLGLNGTTFYGKSYGDWGVHNIGHELSLLYDIPHGASLSMVLPAWLSLHANRISNKIIKLGNALFSATDTEGTIEGFMAFFKTTASPVRLSEMTTDYNRKDILRQLLQNKVSGSCHPLSLSDYEFLTEQML